MYLITPEGLEELEKTGLKKILDKEFPGIKSEMPTCFVYDDDIEHYEIENNKPGLLEKLENVDIIDKQEAFIVYSEIVLKNLGNKIPKKLNQELKNTISAYWIYWDKFVDSYRRRYSWLDRKSLNSIEGDTHGDMVIKQYNFNLNEEGDLFRDTPWVVKRPPNSLCGYYDNWVNMLTNLIGFCCQTKNPVPFQNNWNEIFYNGEFKEEEPGSVAKDCINNLKRFKNNEEHCIVEVLPFTDNQLKHVDIDKGFHLAQPIMPQGGSQSRPFIDNHELVYLIKVEDGKGIELGRMGYWGNESVRYDYEQVKEAIKGVVSCMQRGGTRCVKRDPGLIFKYFPYERFEELE